MNYSTLQMSQTAISVLKELGKVNYWGGFNTHFSQLENQAEEACLTAFEMTLAITTRILQMMTNGSRCYR